MMTKITPSSLEELQLLDGVEGTAREGTALALLKTALLDKET